MPVNRRLKRVLLPGPGPRRVPFGIGAGVRMHVDFASQTRTYLGLYEIEVSRFLRGVLKRGVRALDVGGQHGYDSLLIAQRTRAPVATFEADARCVDGMRENFALNPNLAGLIEPVHAIVGDGAGETGLDDWTYDRGFEPDFIKLDIDGGEVAALRSAQRLLSERRPALLVEVHSAELEGACGALMMAHGYRPTIVNQRRLWPDRRPIEHNRWLVAAG
jgi:Methyltransferase FkbM domain